MPKNGQDCGAQPSPSSPPLPKQLEKPVQPFTENGEASVHTRSMLLLGRLMVTVQLGFCDCWAVPPGHSAESKAPPLLLFTVKVNT